MSRIAIAALVVISLGSPHELSQESFGALHRLILPQAGEFAWYEEIPWLTSVQEAREKAAAEGKPLLVWCSADGQPCGAT
jgi:hypothetical protein